MAMVMGLVAKTQRGILAKAIPLIPNKRISRGRKF
jgi:hypothetical protein